MKILAFGGSSSRTSINQAFAKWAAGEVARKANGTVEILNLNDFEMPLFSVDREAETGPQPKARAFLDQIRGADFLVISLAEHNGSYSVAFKNVLDWASRIDGKVFANKPMLLMATSPGARGGQFVLEAAKTRFPIHAADIRATFSLPEFEKNFREGEGIVSAPLRQKFESAVTEALSQ